MSEKKLLILLVVESGNAVSLLKVHPLVGDMSKGPVNAVQCYRCQVSTQSTWLACYITSGMEGWLQYAMCNAHCAKWFVEVE